jgi:hypothetical protein
MGLQLEGIMPWACSIANSVGLGFSDLGLSWFLFSPSDPNGAYLSTFFDPRLAGRLALPLRGNRKAGHVLGGRRSGGAALVKDRKQRLI